MTFTERLYKRRHWLEALGLCLLLHLGIGILLSGITCHSPKINTFEDFISILPVTEAIEEPQGVSGVMQQSAPSPTAFNEVFKKNQTMTPIPMRSSKKIAHQARSVVKEQGSESQKQPDSAASSITTDTTEHSSIIMKKEDVSLTPFDSLKQGYSPEASENENMHSTEDAGTSAHISSSLQGNRNEMHVAAEGNEKATSTDMLSDYKQYLKASIERAKQYPFVARRRGVEGKVGVVFELDRFGKLLSSRIEMSSGSDVLDEAAICAVRNAAPFSRPPIEDSPLSFMVILNFKLSNSS